MGEVFKARHPKLGRVVALKLIRKERLDNPAAVRRFHREVQAAAQLEHPHIVRAYDADEAGDLHYFVMEYVEGTDLARLVKRDGPLTVDRACDYVRQAALGLQHAYERGMVHRDIKPANLLLTAKGDVVKVLDMGLARLDRPEKDAGASSTLTQEGAVMGTPDYIAPEQARDSHTVDIRADLYSLGCTLYFLLAGRVPFPGGTSDGEAAQAHAGRAAAGGGTAARDAGGRGGGGAQADGQAGRGPLPDAGGSGGHTGSPAGRRWWPPPRTGTRWRRAWLSRRRRRRGRAATRWKRRRKRSCAGRPRAGAGERPRGGGGWRCTRSPDCCRWEWAGWRWCW